MGLIEKTINIVIIIAILFMAIDLYWFRQQGERFTYCDGLRLHSIVLSTSTPSYCNTPTTDFAKYLDEQK